MTGYLVEVSADNGIHYFDLPARYEAAGYGSQAKAQGAAHTEASDLRIRFAQTPGMTARVVAYDM